MNPEFIKKTLSSFLSLTLFIGSSVRAPLAEANIWKERQKSIQLAKLTPQTFSPLIRPSDLARSKILSPTDSLSPKRNPSKDLRESIIETLIQSGGTIRQNNISPSTKNSPILIHIQDVHKNRDAQTNIASTLHHLSSRFDIGFIGVEGAFKKINLNGFHHFANQDAVRIAANYLLDKTKISGPLYESLVNPKLSLIGIDDEDAYTAHVRVVKKSAPSKEETKEKIETAVKKLNEKKKNSFNPSLSLFDAQVRAYRQNKLPISKFVIILDSYSSSVFRPNLDLFLSAAKIESTLNFERAEKERQSLLENLLLKLDKNEEAKLLSFASDLQSQAISPFQFYQELISLCASNQIDLNQFPSFRQYTDYLILSQEINGEKLFGELTDRINEIANNLIRNEQERNLWSASDKLYLAGKLVRFSLNSSEWIQYKNTEKLSDILHTALSEFEDFYEWAIKRDELMAAKTSRLIENNPSNISVIITGGFHSQGLEKYFSTSKNPPVYITYTPKITTIDDENEPRYLGVFTQEKTPLEKFIDGDQLFLSPRQFPPELRIETAASVLSSHEYLSLGNVSSKNERQAYEDLTGLKHTVQFQDGNQEVSATFENDKGKRLKTISQFKKNSNSEIILTSMNVVIMPAVETVLFFVLPTQFAASPLQFSVFLMMGFIIHFIGHPLLSYFLFGVKETRSEIALRLPGLIALYFLYGYFILGPPALDFRIAASIIYSIHSLLNYFLLIKLSFFSHWHPESAGFKLEIFSPSVIKIASVSQQERKDLDFRHNSIFVLNKDQLKKNNYGIITSLTRKFELQERRYRAVYEEWMTHLAAYPKIFSRGEKITTHLHLTSIPSSDSPREFHFSLGINDHDIFNRRTDPAEKFVMYQDLDGHYHASAEFFHPDAPLNIIRHLLLTQAAILTKVKNQKLANQYIAQHTYQALFNNDWFAWPNKESSLGHPNSPRNPLIFILPLYEQYLNWLKNDGIRIAYQGTNKEKQMSVESSLRFLADQAFKRFPFKRNHRTEIYNNLFPHSIAVALDKFENNGIFIDSEEITPQEIDLAVRNWMAYQILEPENLSDRTLTKDDWDENQQIRSDILNRERFSPLSDLLKHQLKKKITVIQSHSIRQMLPEILKAVPKNTLFVTSYKHLMRLDGFNQIPDSRSFTPRANRYVVKKDNLALGTLLPQIIASALKNMAKGHSEERLLLKFFAKLQDLYTQNHNIRYFHDINDEELLYPNPQLTEGQYKEQIRNYVLELEKIARSSGLEHVIILQDGDPHPYRKSSRKEEDFFTHTLREIFGEPVHTALHFSENMASSEHSAMMQALEGTAEKSFGVKGPLKGQTNLIPLFNRPGERYLHKDYHDLYISLSRPSQMNPNEMSETLIYYGGITLFALALAAHLLLGKLDFTESLLAMTLIGTLSAKRMRKPRKIELVNINNLLTQTSIWQKEIGGLYYGLKQAAAKKKIPAKEKYGDRQIIRLKEHLSDFLQKEVRPHRRTGYQNLRNRITEHLIVAEQALKENRPTQAVSRLKRSLKLAQDEEKFLFQIKSIRAKAYRARYGKIWYRPLKKFYELTQGKFRKETRNGITTSIKKILHLPFQHIMDVYQEIDQQVDDELNYREESLLAIDHIQSAISDINNNAPTEAGFDPVQIDLNRAYHAIGFVRHIVIKDLAKRAIRTAQLEWEAAQTKRALNSLTEAKDFLEDRINAIDGMLDNLTGPTIESLRETSRERNNFLNKKINSLKEKIGQPQSREIELTFRQILNRLPQNEEPDLKGLREIMMRIQNNFNAPSQKPWVAIDINKALSVIEESNELFDFFVFYRGYFLQERLRNNSENRAKKLAYGKAFSDLTDKYKIPASHSIFRWWRFRTATYVFIPRKINFGDKTVPNPVFEAREWLFRIITTNSLDRIKRDFHWLWKFPNFRNLKSIIFSFKKHSYLTSNEDSVELSPSSRNSFLWGLAKSFGLTPNDLKPSDPIEDASEISSQLALSIFHQNKLRQKSETLFSEIKNPNDGLVFGFLLPKEISLEYIQTKLEEIKEGRFRIGAVRYISPEKRKTLARISATEGIPFPSDWETSADPAVVFWLEQSSQFKFINPEGTLFSEEGFSEYSNAKVSPYLSNSSWQGQKSRKIWIDPAQKDRSTWPYFSIVPLAMMGMPEPAIRVLGSFLFTAFVLYVFFGKQRAYRSHYVGSQQIHTLNHLLGPLTPHLDTIDGQIKSKPQKSLVILVDRELEKSWDSLTDEILIAQQNKIPVLIAHFTSGDKSPIQNTMSGIHYQAYHPNQILNGTFDLSLLEETIEHPALKADRIDILHHYQIHPLTSRLAENSWIRRNGRLISLRSMLGKLIGWMKIITPLSIDLESQRQATQNA